MALINFEHIHESLNFSILSPKRQQEILPVLTIYDRQTGTHLFGVAFMVFLQPRSALLRVPQPSTRAGVAQENEKWERNIRMCSSGVDDPTSALHCGTFWVTCSIFLAKCRRASSAGTTHIYLAEYH